MEPLTDQLPVPAVPTIQSHDEGISYSKKNRETLSFAGYTGPRIKIPETLLKDGRLDPPPKKWTLQERSKILFICMRC